MNILVIGKLYPDTFTLHIYETLKSLGHKVFDYQPGLKSLPTNSNLVKSLNFIRDAAYNAASQIPLINKIGLNHLKNLIGNDKIDLTISVHDYLTPEQVIVVKNISKAPVVLWHPDGLHNFGKSMFLNADYDYLFFKDPYVVEYFKNTLLKNSFYLPECCNPEYHKPVELSNADRSIYGCDITTAGNLYPNREAFFSNLSKYDIKIWGNPAPIWMDISRIKKMIMNKYVLNEEKVKAFLSAKIVLNNLNPGEIWGINCRAFEIAACGGFQMINFRQGLKQLFEIDKEVVAFNNFNELSEKIDYYLEHDSERNTIALAGKERTHRDHTYGKRLQLLIDTVFGNKRGFEYL